MRCRPYPRLPTLQRQRALAQELVADREAALSPFSDRGFRHQFVTVGRWNHKPSPRLHQRDADDTMCLEQLLYGKPRRAKQRSRTLIEPAKIVGIEDNLRRIAISPLDHDSNTIHKHS